LAEGGPAYSRSSAGCTEKPGLRKKIPVTLGCDFEKTATVVEYWVCPRLRMKSNLSGSMPTLQFSRVFVAEEAE